MLYLYLSQDPIQHFASLKPTTYTPRQFALKNWDILFKNYPDKKRYLQQRKNLQYGVKLADTDLSYPSFTSTTGKWTPRGKKLTAIELIKWHTRGYVFGPVTANWVRLNKGVVHHFFDVPKGEKVRPILNLSDTHSIGYSLNDKVKAANYSVEYIQQLEIIEMLQALGKGAYLWAKDLEWGYNNLPIWHKHVPKLCLSFDGRLYCYQVLPMGLSSACMLFTEFMHFPLWAIKNQDKKLFYITVPEDSVILDHFGSTADVKHHDGKVTLAVVTHYLDDILGGHRTLEGARRQCTIVDKILKFLGLAAQESKNKPPATTQEWLGKEYNTITQTVRLTDAKQKKYVSGIQKLLRKTHATRRVLLSHIGRVRFAGSIYRPLNAFARGMERWAFTVKKEDDFVHISPGVKRDFNLAVWGINHANKRGAKFNTFRHSFNKPLRIDATILTDASVTVGVGGICSLGQHYQHKWTEVTNFQHSKRDILWKELCGVYMALHCWKEQLRGKWVHVYTDNDPVKWMLIKMRARLYRHDLQVLINDICQILLSNEIEMWIDHIPGKQNIAADALSRYFANPLQHAPFKCATRTDATHSLLRASLLTARTNVDYKHLSFHDDDL